MTRITFNDWRKQFDKSLQVHSPAWQALQGWLEHFSSQTEPPEWTRVLPLDESCWPHDIRTFALQILYLLTMPRQRLTDKRDFLFTRKKLETVTGQAKDLIDYIERLGEPPRVASDQNGHRLIHLTNVLEAYKRAVFESNLILSLVKNNYIRERELPDQVLAILNVSDQIKIPHPKSCDLARVALLAHGYSSQQTEMLRDPGKLRSNYFRKRQKLRNKQQKSWFDKLFGKEGMPKKFNIYT